MYNQRRGIYRPTLKVNAFPSVLSSKRFIFDSHAINRDFQRQRVLQKVDFPQSKYPNLGQANLQGRWGQISLQQNQIDRKISKKNFSQDLYQQKVISSPTVARFDPILPKFVFKRFVDNVELSNDRLKFISNQMIQQLKVRNVNYPIQVERLFRQTENNKIIYQKHEQNKYQSKELNPMQQQKQVTEYQKKWAQNSYRQALNKQNFGKNIRKIPYFPLMGTDGSIFWSHSFDKVILWRYFSGDFSQPEVFCILDFKTQSAPISAVFGTEIKGQIFKNQRTILISVAFYNQLQFFTFDIQKYQREYLVQLNKNEKTPQDFLQYVEKILIKVNSCFAVEKIIIKNLVNHNSPHKNVRPLVIFTDGGKDIEIVDLENISAYKSHVRYDPFSIFKRQKDDKDQNQIIKLLHCNDEINQFVNYAFVLRKETSLVQVRAKSLLGKIKSALGLTKRTDKKQQIILSIYEWNQLQLKNDSIVKKLFNPQRLNKVREITSRELQLRIKQNFFQFSKLNSNTQFSIADVSLIQKQQKYRLFSQKQNVQNGCLLKVSFSNGGSVLISNFKLMTFFQRAKVNPYIQKSVQISGCQYQNYRRLLQKGKYLKSLSQIKNKFNFYIYEPNYQQKQPKYCPIDPVISQCNGLSICENKMIYQDQSQVLYNFTQSTSRKRIHQLNLNKDLFKKSWLVFENSHITLVSTPNIAQSLIPLVYLLKKYPTKQNHHRIHQFVSSLFSEWSQTFKIQFVQSIIKLLILIYQSGKTRHIPAENKFSFEEIVKQMSNKNERNPDFDETVYIDDSTDPYSKKSHEIYQYNYQITKNQYQNFLQYLLGPQVLAKEKEYLKMINYSYNGKILQIKITEQIFNYLIGILIQYGIKNLSQKPVKSARNLLQVNSSVSKYINDSVSNSNDQKFLTHIFTNMNYLQESFLACSLSKLLVFYLKPILSLSYSDFYHIKQKTVKIVQCIDQIQKFLQIFFYHASFQNDRREIFGQTILFCKSLHNSLPKISLLVKLFNVLSEAQYYNLTLKNDHKHLSKEITLKNLLFKTFSKELLARITVEDLFDDNALLLDQIQQKLPQINQIKNLRYFTGWKKINQKIIDSYGTDVTYKSHLQSQPNFIFQWLSNSKSNPKTTKRSLLLEHQNSPQSSSMIEKNIQQTMLIQKSLNEYSFEDYARYFIVTQRFFQFSQILWSKTCYLQKIYLDYKARYNFDQCDLSNQKTLMQIQRKDHQQKVKYQLSIYDESSKNRSKQIKDGVKQQIVKSKLGQFLVFQQKVYNHSQYLKIYEQIRFLNEKMIEYILRVLQVYQRETCKYSQDVISSSQQDLHNKHRYYNQSYGNGSNRSNQSYYFFLSGQVQKIVELVSAKGSKLVAQEVFNRLSSSQLFTSFLLGSGLFSSVQAKTQNTLYVAADQQDQIYMMKNLTQQDRSGQILENTKVRQDTKRMYQQKMDQKFPDCGIQKRLINQQQLNWMQQHNRESSQNIFNKSLYR